MLTLLHPVKVFHIIDFYKSESQPLNISKGCKNFALKSDFVYRKFTSYREEKYEL